MSGPNIQTAGRFVLPEPAEPDDVGRSLEAILAYDGRTDLDAINHQTLVIGGEKDPYVTADVQRETADGIETADVSLIPGANHGAFHERKSTFDRQVTRFLTG